MRGGRGGGWRGRGRGAPTGPVAKDEDGTILDTQPAGPPPTFPETELPHHPDFTAKEELLLIRRNDLAQAMKKSPFILETKAVDDKSDIDAQIQRWSDIKPLAPLAGDASGEAAPSRPRKRPRTRDPLSTVIRLLPEYFPDELYSSSDRRAARLQDTYWARAGKKDDAGALQRLEALAALEGKEGAQEGDGDGEPEPVEEVVDTDDEEEMDDDDYYKGAHFDDDEGYDDGFDDGGDDGPVF